MAIIHLNYFSPALSLNTDVNIILPEGEFAKPGRKFQTLYLLHGTLGDYTDWCRKSAIERYAQQACLAVVMPSCANAFYQDMAHGPQYKTFLLEELPAYLSFLLPLSTRREDTFIAGLSMGGYGALHLALEKPGQYMAAASLSGLLHFAELAKQDTARGKRPWPLMAITGPISPQAIRRSGRNVLVQARRLVERGAELPRLFMSVGTEDSLLEANREGAAQLEALGVPLTYEEHPGSHTWAFWDTHIQRVIDWLPLQRDTVDS